MRKASKHENRDIEKANDSTSPNNIMFDSQFRDYQTGNIVFNPNLSNSSPIQDNYSFVCLNADKAMSPVA